MDSTDMKILKAIDTVSPKTFISPVKVNEVLGMDATELGNRLLLLNKSEHVDIIISECISSLNIISPTHPCPKSF
jgi:hypothetical protein